MTTSTPSNRLELSPMVPFSIPSSYKMCGLDGSRYADKRQNTGKFTRFEINWRISLTYSSSYAPSSNGSHESSPPTAPNSIWSSAFDTGLYYCSKAWGQWIFTCSSGKAVRSLG
jgi:hypothetical protein